MAWERNFYAPEEQVDLLVEHIDHENALHGPTMDVAQHSRLKFSHLILFLD